MKPWQWLLLGGFILAVIGGGIVANVSTPDFVTRFAQAIAQAEGFFLAGSLSSRRNNPGDLKDASGQIAMYATPEDGWAALTHQVSLMFFGGSAYYHKAMTIAQVAYKYADGANDPAGATNWGNNVAEALGVTTDTTLEALMLPDMAV